MRQEEKSGKKDAGGDKKKVPKDKKKSVGFSK
jgi:hypothetical protein